MSLPKLRWTPDMERQLAALLLADPSPATVRIENARKTLSAQWGRDLTYLQISMKRRELDKAGRLAHAVPDAAPLPAYDPAPVLTGAWTLPEGTGWAIYGDDHGAHVDFALFSLMCNEARRLGITHLLNGGDKWHADAFSKHARIIPPTPFAQEKRTQRRLRALAETTFETEYILSGNHDKWIPKKMDGSLSAEDLEETFLGWLGERPGGAVKWSVYGYCTIDSPRLGPVRVSHPKNYSRIKATTAAKLATKYATHVLTFHEHARGARLVETERGDRWAVSVGCMADPRQFAYAQLEDSTAPAMQQGFALLQDGVLHLYGEGGYLTSVGQIGAVHA